MHLNSLTRPLTLTTGIRGNANDRVLLNREGSGVK